MNATPITLTEEQVQQAEAAQAALHEKNQRRLFPERFPRPAMARPSATEADCLSAEAFIDLDFYLKTDPDLHVTVLSCHPSFINEDGSLTGSPHCFFIRLSLECWRWKGGKRPSFGSSG